MAGSRTFEIKLVGDARDAVNAFQQLGQHMSGVNTKSVTLGTTLGNLISRGLTSLAGGVMDAARAFADLAVESVQLASDANEATSKAQVVFGKYADGLIKWSESAATAMGLSSRAAIDAAGTFGNLFVSMKIGQGQSSNMSQALVGLASDLASFNNTSVGDAMEALRSGLVGETEPLRKFGINLNDATLKAEAMRLGLIKTTSEALTPAAKAQAAYSLIMQQSTTAQGDFARTSDGLANQQRILAAQWEDAKTRIGNALLPVYKAVVKVLTEKLLPAFESWIKDIGPKLEENLQNFAKWITDSAIPALQEFWKWIQEKAVPVLKEYAEYIKNDVWPTVQKFAELLGALGEAFGKSSDAAGGSADTFDTIKWIFEQLGEALDKLRTIMQFAIGQIHMLGDTVSGIITGFSAVNDVIVNFTTTLANLASQATAAVIAVVGNLYNIGRDAITGFANGVYEVWATVNQWFGGMPGRIVGAIGSLISAATGRGREAISGLLSGIGDRWNDAAAWLSGTGSRIVNAIGGLGSALITRGREAMSGLQEGISDRWGSVSSWLGGLPQRAKDAVGDTAGKLFNAGRQLIAGFKDGVLDAVSGLIDAVTGAIGKAIQAAKDKLKINSPSRVFMEIGEGAMEGMALGIEAAAPIAARASSGAAGITAAAATDLGGSSGVLSTGSGGTINVTINAGLGTDPRELGRVVTDAIKQYERSSGPVFRAA